MKRFEKNTVISLVAAAALIVSAVCESNLKAKGMRIATDRNAVYITTGERILMRYRYNNVPYKPYVDQLFSPSGVNILLDAPHDHLHHHALMYAIKVDGVNFWEEQQSPGQQTHRSFTDVRVDERQKTPFAGFSEQLDWSNPRSKESLLAEERTIEASYLLGPKVTLLTWQSAFRPGEGMKSVTLTGSHYHGLGLRFIRSMDNGGEFRNADGKPGTVFRGDEKLVRSRWCAYTAKADDKQVTVAMFDHPKNERHPATWFTMTEPFAYLSATLNLHEQPLNLASDKPLELRYAVAIWDGQTETDEIEKAYKAWTAPPRETSAEPNKKTE